LAERFDLILRGGAVATPSGVEPADIGVIAGRIAALGALGGASAAETVDCTGLTVLPGVIDTQVHFREPGGEHKEDLATGTAAAVAGGVTAIFEMPNTTPLTTSAEALADKLARARGRAWCDHAFFVGGTATNAEDLPRLERLPGCAGVKIFMGSSTGDLLSSDDGSIGRILANGRRRVAVHAEDEERLKERRAMVADGAPVRMHPEWRDVETALGATRRLLRLASEARRRVHVLHVTTGEEMELLAGHKALATVEVTPQHLTFAGPECYDVLGSRAQMNPPIRDEAQRAALWRAVADGTVDVLGSDHAPHTLEEKARPYPQSPSGMTGVQTLVPVMLTHVAEGRLTLQRFIDLTSAGPARVFGIAGKGRIARGYDADFTIVDLDARRRITDGWIRSRSAWTPYDGVEVIGWPVMTVLRGRVVMRDDELLGEPAGAPVRFLECLDAG
jgi:dihydroorotase